MPQKQTDLAIPALPPGFKIDPIPALPPGFKLDSAPEQKQVSTEKPSLFSRIAGSAMDTFTNLSEGNNIYGQPKYPPRPLAGHAGVKGGTTGPVQDLDEGFNPGVMVAPAGPTTLAAVAGARAAIPAMWAALETINVTKPFAAAGAIGRATIAGVKAGVPAFKARKLAETLSDIKKARAAGTLPERAPVWEEIKKLLPEKKTAAPSEPMQGVPRIRGGPKASEFKEAAERAEGKAVREASLEAGKKRTMAQKIQEQRVSKPPDTPVQPVTPPQPDPVVTNARVGSSRPVVESTSTPYAMEPFDASKMSKEEIVEQYRTAGRTNKVNRYKEALRLEQAGGGKVPQTIVEWRKVADKYGLPMPSQKTIDLILKALQ